MDKKTGTRLDAPPRRRPEVYLSALYIYPIKSAGGISLEACKVDERGLHYDRRWMLVDAAGRFMSQRWYPRMALIEVRIEPDHLLVEAPEMSPLVIPLQPPTATRRLAQVWSDLVEVSPVGGEADRWFGEYLGVSCSLVYLPDESIRPVDPAYGSAGDRVGLADGFPFLLISEASLADRTPGWRVPCP